MRENQTRRSARLARALLVASRWFIMTPLILIIVLLSAGTFHVPAFHRYAPIFDLGLTSLSMVSYYGIVPQLVEAPYPDKGDFMFKLYQFPNAFGWECPACKTGKEAGGWVYLSGVTTSGPRLSFEPARLMCEIAEEGGKRDKYEKWDCCTFGPLDGTEKKCKNEFLGIWHKAWEDHLWYRQSPAWLNFVMYLAAIFMAATTLLNEFLIAYQPHRMKCRCYLGRWCPCPKGTFEEIEALDEHAWDRVRLYYYGVTAFLFILPAMHDTIMPGYFIAFLKVVDQRLPEGVSMNPQRGRPFLIMVWGSVVLAALAFGFIWMRWTMAGKPRGWMDGQSLEDVPIIREEDAYDPDEDGLNEEVDQTLDTAPPPYSDTDTRAGGTITERQVS